LRSVPSLWPVPVRLPIRSLPWSALIGFAIVGFVGIPALSASDRRFEPGSHATGLGAPFPVIRVVADEGEIWQQPDANGPRRGALDNGTTLRVYARRVGPRCRGDWLLVGALAWLCDDPKSITWVRSDAFRSPPRLPVVEFALILPQGAFGYTHLGDAGQGVPDAEMQPGYLVGVADRNKGPDGEEYLQTTHGIWLSSRDVTEVRPSPFVGVRLAQQSLSIGWVYVEHARLHDSPGGPPSAAPPLERLTSVQVLDRGERRGQRWLRVPQGWLSAAEIRVPELSEPPAGIRPDERWLDVDLTSQTLVAYAGAQPQFATMISAGRGRPGTPTATPTGTFRIWVKLTSSDMDNLDEEHAESTYAVEAVPWVMFFDRGYGLHGTYWHSAFGTPHSHGCINLSLQDARWIFDFVAPKVPPGWRAARPTSYDLGSVVRIR